MNRFAGLCLAALLAGATVGSSGDAEEFYSFPFYKTQHGAPNGHPGCFSGTKEVTDKKTGKTTKVPKYPKYGHPQLENYLGSVDLSFQYNTASVGRRYLCPTQRYSRRKL